MSRLCCRAAEYASPPPGHGLESSLIGSIQGDLHAGIRFEEQRHIRQAFTHCQRLNIRPNGRIGFIGRECERASGWKRIFLAGYRLPDSGMDTLQIITAGRNEIENEEMNLLIE